MNHLIKLTFLLIIITSHTSFAQETKSSSGLKVDSLSVGVKDCDVNDYGEIVFVNQNDYILYIELYSSALAPYTSNNPLYASFIAQPGETVTAIQVPSGFHYCLVCPDIKVPGTHAGYSQIEVKKCETETCNIQ